VESADDAANLKAESDGSTPTFRARDVHHHDEHGVFRKSQFRKHLYSGKHHIDYFGIDPYPVRSDMATVNYNMIDKA